MAGELGDIYNVLHAMTVSGDARDAANLVASNDSQVQDAPGAPVGSGLANYWAQNSSAPLPAGLQGMIATKQATALQKVGQDYASGNVDQPTALMKIGAIKGEDPSVTISKIAYNRAMGWDKTPPAPQGNQATGNAMAAQAPALASMGGVQPAPITPMNGGDSTPNAPAPTNVSGSMPYPGLNASTALLNGGAVQSPQQPAAPRTAAFMPPTTPQAAMPVNASPVAIGTSQVESGGKDYNPDGSIVTSPKGAQYAMQVMPATAANPGLGVTPAKDNSPAEMNRVGVDYQQALLKRYGGNQQLAAAAYNGGLGRVDAAMQQAGGDPTKALALMPAETQAYVPKVAAATNAVTPSAAMPTGLSPQAMAAMNLSGGGIDPLKMMELQSTLGKNAAETQMDTAKANEAAEAANTARWTRGETGSPPSPQAAGTSQPVMASDNKPLIPSLANGVQYAPDPQHSPDFMPTLPPGASKAQQDVAVDTAKTQKDSAIKQYEGFGTLAQSLSNEKYYAQRMATIYQAMQSPNAAAEYPEIAKTAYNLGFISSPNAVKSLADIQEAINTGTKSVLQSLKEQSAGLDANHPMRIFGSEVNAGLETAIDPSLTPTARYNSVMTTLGLANRNLEAINSYNSPSVGGLGNRLNGGKTMPPTEYVQQFIASHDAQDYRQAAVAATPQFKGQASNSNTSGGTNWTRVNGKLVQQ